MSDKTWMQRNLTLITDTMQDENGKWSIKRVAAFCAFYAGIIYAFLPAWIKDFQPLEFIFWGIFGFAGTVIIGSTWEKMKSKFNSKPEDDSAQGT
jgi:hypothetical protein